MKKVLYILGELEDDDAEWLKKVGISRLLSEGEVLIHEGRPIESLFFVTQGTFAVTAGESAEKVATVGTGEVLGEISFVDRRPPTATVTAAEDSGVLAIPKDVLIAKLHDDPGFAGRFYRAVALFLADRLRSTLRHVAGEAEDDELDLYELEAFSRAGARFEGILRHIQGV
jgi:CRP/FNR family transcriptional regulator, cyclic AMP receptor protein